MDAPSKKFTKVEVQYGPSSCPREHRCQICIFLQGRSPNHECAIVEGHVEDMDGCNRFEKDLIRDALHILPKE